MPMRNEITIGGVVTCGWILCWLLSCRVASAPSPPARSGGTHFIPDEPPEELFPGIAAQIYHPSNIVCTTPFMTGPFPRDVISLVFRPGVSRERKQSVVDGVGAELIGGTRISPDGFYYLRVAADSLARPLQAALLRLKADSSVRLAGPDLLMGPC